MSSSTGQVSQLALYLWGPVEVASVPVGKDAHPVDFVSINDLLVAWEAHAAAVDGWRRTFAESLRADLPTSPPEVFQEYMKILQLALSEDGDCPCLYPEDQQVLLDRGKQLLAKLEAELKNALPQRRANTTIPPPEHVARLFQEARRIMGKTLREGAIKDLLQGQLIEGVVAHGPTEDRDRARWTQRAPEPTLAREFEAAYRDKRRVLVALWTRRNAPLTVGEGRIKTTQERCLAVLAEIEHEVDDIAELRDSGSHKLRVSDFARALVAALLETTPEMIKKALKQGPG